MPSSQDATSATIRADSYSDNTAAFMDSLLDLPPEEPKLLSDTTLDITPTSPPLGPSVFDPSPLRPDFTEDWGSSTSDSPDLFQTNLVDLGLDIATSRTPPTTVPPLQTTLTPSTFLGHPSPPNSSEHSPAKYAPPRNISPLDSLLVNGSDLATEGSRTVYGQVTPPGEYTTSPKLATVRSSLILPQRLTPPETSPVTSPRSSISAQQRMAPQIDLTNTDGGAQTNTTARKRRSSSAQSNAARKQRKNSGANDDPPDAQEAKRRRFLERNRVAASKCRQKKKAWMQDLEQEARDAQNMSKQLKMCVTMFKEEILQLKNELLKHNTCDCMPIRQYLSHEAMRLGSAGTTSVASATSTSAIDVKKTVSNSGAITSPDITFAQPERRSKLTPTISQPEFDMGFMDSSPEATMT